MIWFLMLPLEIAFTLLALILAPVLPLFARDEYGFSDNANAMRTEPRLPSWLSWFMTPDNSLYGDAGWRTEHCPDHWQDYWGMVQWLWRNSAYGFNWHGPICARLDPGAKVTFSGDPHIQNRPNFKPGYCLTTVTNPDGSSYWHLYWVKRINAQYCFNVNLGWKLKTYAEDPTRLKTESRAMFSFSPRIAGYSVQP